MNKTLYLKDEDGPIWDKARELSGDKLSPVILAALKQFVAEKEAERSEMQRIEIRYKDLGSEGRPTAKAFHGRWLIPPEEDFQPDLGFHFRESPFDKGLPVVGRLDNYLHFAVAVSVKGAVVLFQWIPSGASTNLPSGGLSVHSSFDQALKANALKEDARATIHEAMVRQGVPIQVLDI